MTSSPPEKERRGGERPRPPLNPGSFYTDRKKKVLVKPCRKGKKKERGTSCSGENDRTGGGKEKYRWPTRHLQREKNERRLHQWVRAHLLLTEGKDHRL